MFPRRLASAPRFFVLLLVVHIIPPNSSESYVIFYGARTSGRSPPASGGKTRAHRLFRLSPVAQHLPAGTVREAREALEEVELGRFPHRSVKPPPTPLRSQALEEEAVGPFFAAANE